MFVLLHLSTYSQIRGQIGSHLKGTARAFRKKLELLDLQDHAQYETLKSEFDEGMRKRVECLSNEDWSSFQSVRAPDAREAAIAADAREAERAADVREAGENGADARVGESVSQKEGEKTVAIESENEEKGSSSQSKRQLDESEVEQGGSDLKPKKRARKVNGASNKKDAGENAKAKNTDCEFDC